jgi:DNA-binding NarL/FixJ family response regulator
MSNDSHWAERVVVLVVDDHPLVREALVQALEVGVTSPGAQGVAAHIGGAPALTGLAAGSVAQARQRLQSQSGVAAVLADHRLPDGDGVSLLLQVRSYAPRAARILLSGVDDPGLAVRARNLGLDGFLSKSLEPAQIVAGVHAALRGQPCFPTSVAASALPVLTHRQAEVLALIGRGCSNKEAARFLGVTERTVKDHLTIAFARLSVNTRAEAVARAGALGLIPLG